MTADDEQAAVAVIRVWREGGAEPGDLRARVTQTVDADTPGWEERVVAGEDGIIAAVRAWLQEFASR